MSETPVDLEISGAESVGSREVRLKAQVEAALMQLMGSDKIDPEEANRIAQKPSHTALEEIKRFHRLVENVTKLKALGAINEDHEQEIMPNGNGMSTLNAFHQTNLLLDLRPQILQMEKDGIISSELSEKLLDVYFVGKLKWRNGRKIERKHGVDVYLTKRKLDAIKYIRQTKERLKKEGKWTQEDDKKYDFNRVDPLVAETHMMIEKL